MTQETQEQLVDMLTSQYKEKKKSSENAEKRMRIREIQDRMEKRKRELEENTELRDLEAKEEANKALLKKKFYSLSHEDQQRYNDLLADTNGERIELQAKIKKIKYKKSRSSNVWQGGGKKACKSE